MMLLIIAGLLLMLVASARKPTATIDKSARMVAVAIARTNRLRLR